MSIDEYNPEESVMLDAGGHYDCGPRASDVLEGNQIDITIDAYLAAFDSEEILTTYELTLSVIDEEKIREEIENINGRTSFSCAIRASTLLKDTGLLDGIKVYRTPVGLQKFLQKYAEENPSKVRIKKYSFSTKGEIYEK